MGSITVDAAAGVPRLEAPAQDAPLPRDHELPPEGAGPDVQQGPPPPGTVIVPKWTPQQATQMTSATFGLGGGGFLVFRRRAQGLKLLPHWYAHPHEFDPAAEPLARLWDRVPYLEPSNGDGFGLVADLMAAMPVVIEVGVRHARAVLREIERDEREAAAREAQMPEPAAPATGAASPTYTPPASPAPGPAPSPASNGAKRKREPGGAYHFDPSQLQFLEVARSVAGDQHGSIRNPEAA